jgi:hypothetical protein
VVVSGHAKLPKEAAARAIYEVLSIVVAADLRQGVVVEVDSTLVTQPAKTFVRELLLGVSLDESPDAVLGCVERYYWGGAKRALAAAVRDLYDKWREYRGVHGEGGAA